MGVSGEHGSSPDVVMIRAYEKKIAELSSEKLVLQEKAANTATPKHTFEEMFELAIQFLKPMETLTIQEFRVQKIGAQTRVCRPFGVSAKYRFSNSKNQYAFQLLESFSADKKAMARPTGFELLYPI